VVCQGAGRAMLFNGLPEKPIDGIDLKKHHHLCIAGCRVLQLQRCEKRQREGDCKKISSKTG
jgi:hypothetical protein